MFSRIRPQSTTFLRRFQNAQHTIRNPTKALTTAAATGADHTPDSYSKEVDHTPPSDAKIHRVDPDSDLVQKPYEAPSGEWSRAGVKTDEYRSVESEKQPYSMKGGVSGRYGAGSSAGSETSKSDEGPNEKSSHGRGG